MTPSQREYLESVIRAKVAQALELRQKEQEMANQVIQAEDGEDRNLRSMACNGYYQAASTIDQQVGKLVYEAVKSGGRIQIATTLEGHSAAEAALQSAWRLLNQTAISKDDVLLELYTLIGSLINQGD